MRTRQSFTRPAAVCLALAALLAAAVPHAPASAQGGQNPKGPGGRDEAHEDAPRGRVAFSSDLDGDFDLYVVNPAGGGLREITDDAGAEAEDLDPSFSPDGRRIAFTSDRDGNQEIYAVDENGANPTRLTNNPAPDRDPAWSPDGARIAFTSERDGDANVYLMNADGSNVVRLTDSTAQDYRPSWSPDGARIAFTSERDGNGEIYVMNANGSGQTNVTNNPADDVNPAFSQMRITFQSDRDGNDEIYSMGADGSNPLRLTNHAAFDGRPARSMDGARIVFVSERDGAGDLNLYAINADGSNPVRLTSGEQTDLDPDVEPLVANVPASSFQFDPSSVVAGEGAGGVTLTVTRAGSTAGAALVDFATLGGTASDRTDFTPVFRTLEFAPGQTSVTVSVPIIDDAFVEQDETFVAVLGNPTGATLGAAAQAAVTITDNDGGRPANATLLFALTTDNRLLTFDSSAPGTVRNTAAVTGLQTGESLVGIDVRPATQQLYGVGSAGRLYILNPASGRAFPAPTVSTALSGAAFGVDFNPVPDRLRVVSDADQNLRINVETGAATADGALAYDTDTDGAGPDTGDANAGQNPNVVAAAYTNSVAGATATTLYGIDSNLDVLVIQNPPNNGTLNTVGQLGVNASDLAGFDIAAGGNAAFAALTAGGASVSQLYAVNLTTGAAAPVGDIGGGAAVRGLAAANFGSSNPIDRPDFFVRQQYLDFLNREPDAGGLRFWTDTLTQLISQCPSAQTTADERRARNFCVLRARAQVSAAFFLSIEFQETGFFVIRVYQEAFGRLPAFREFLEDLGDIRRGVVIGEPGALELLARNRREFLERFVDREEFRLRYAGVSNAAYVNALLTNAGVDPSAEAATRDALVAGLNNGAQTRATALAAAADTRSVFNTLYNRAFVLMEYFGYLRRDPDPPGFQFWLDRLNEASVPDEDLRDPRVAFARIRRSNTVEAFIASIEYRQRFGP